MSSTTVPIGDICRVVGGGTPARDVPQYYGGDIPWVTPKDMKMWEIQDAQIKITRAGLENSATRLVPENSVLVVVRSGVLKHTVPVAISRTQVAINQDMKAFICSEHVDPDYLARFIKAQSPEILQWVRATTADNFPVDKLKKLRISLPPLPEQRRIADILDKADALRAKRRAALSQLEALTQSIFLDMFGDPVTNPKGWPVAALAQKCTLAGEYGANVASKEFDPDLPRYVRITDVTEDGDLNDQPVSPGGNPKDWEPYDLAAGDVLFARSGATVGKTYMHRASDGRCVFAGYMIRFRADRHELLPEYLFTFTRSSAYRAWVAARQRVVAQPNINAKQYGQELLIPLPPIRLQEAFAARMGDIQRTKALSRASGVQLDELFSTLQHAAFRGEL
ncbi:MAG: restriction endonuclease subunit S [Geminicoccaceae bacterium]